MIRVLIADDHGAIRAGLSLILKTAEDIIIVGEASDGHAAIRNAHALRPDVILMDVRMPGTDGIEATRVLAAEGFKIVVLTTYEQDSVVYGAIVAGAAGFLMKSCESSALIEAVRRVAAGDGVLAPEVTLRIMSRMALTEATSLGSSQNVREGRSRLQEAGLTDREVDVLTEIANGRSNSTIARRLNITVGTTKTHVSRVLTKLGLESRTQAALAAKDLGLL